MEKDYSKEVHLSFYFERSIFSNSDLVSLLKDIPKWGFSVSAVHEDVEITYDEFIKDDENIISSFEENNLIIDFDNLNGCMFLINTETNNIELISIIITFFYDVDIVEEILCYFLNKSGLYYGCFANGYDIKWQNETSIKAFEINNKSLISMNFTTDIFGDKIVDITYNYGRTINKNGIVYNAAYRSWFGEKLIKKYSAKKIKDYKNFRSVKELETGVIEVQLFDELLGDYSNKREIQKDYLEYFGIK